MQVNVYFENHITVNSLFVHLKLIFFKNRLVLFLTIRQGMDSEVTFSAFPLVPAAGTPWGRVWVSLPPVWGPWTSDAAFGVSG